MGLASGDSALLRAGRAGRCSHAFLLAGTAVASFFAVVASAQEREPVAAEPAQPGQADTTLLDRITIISRTGETPIETMASVSQVEGEQLERRMASTPQDLLFSVPGVSVQADSKRVASSVNIRGLQDFGRVAVIVDGARQNFQRSGHGTQSMVFIDPELVQQVDVIRGPVANTYGSGAIGGVVFFDTKDAEDFLLPHETYAVSTTGRLETNGPGWTNSTVGAYRVTESFDVLGNIVWRDNSDYRDGSGDLSEGTGFDVLSGLVKSTIRPTENSELKLGWMGADDGWVEGLDRYDVGLKQNTFTARYHMADPDQPWLDLHVNTAYSRTGLDQTFLQDAAQYHSGTGMPIVIPAGSRTTYDLDTLGVDVWNTSRFATGPLDHELTYGGDWLSDDVETESPAGGSDVYTPSGKRRVWGAYIQDKIRFDWFEIVGALRYDSYSLDGASGESSGDRLSPRLTVGISPFEGGAMSGLQFYGTYAEGYRSPTVTETLMSGLHPNGVVFPFLPNPDLRPETAKTWELGINYGVDGLFHGDDRLRLKAAYFHNDISDYIGLRELSAFDPTAGCPFVPGPGRIPICNRYENFAEARIQGFELEGIYDAGAYFGGLSVSLMDGYRVSEGVREDLIDIPSSQVTAQLGVRLLEERLTLGGEVQYNAAPDGNDYADDYTLVNLFASYRATDNFRFDLRADNIFDVKYAHPLNASTTTPVYEPGINIKLAATLRFGG
ncbi:TonB-dependent receptor [Chelativorans sp. Marseille-P2723]|uniref:TonB-dependent receptor domain-containing protein n=1 Tax=Chelativorans sp. Marseille-P2723 TaxID=2709133 RepID=UPI00156E25D2|nr:TonB-dependent receptor [Chelativorans sp. Marseille-P2723]